MVLAPKLERWMMQKRRFFLDRALVQVLMLLVTVGCEWAPVAGSAAGFSYPEPVQVETTFETEAACARQPRSSDARRVHMGSKRGIRITETKGLQSCTAAGLSLDYCKKSLQTGVDLRRDALSTWEARGQEVSSIFCDRLEADDFDDTVPSAWSVLGGKPMTLSPSALEAAPMMSSRVQMNLSVDDADLMSLKKEVIPYQPAQNMHIQRLCNGDSRDRSET